MLLRDIVVEICRPIIVDLGCGYGGSTSLLVETCVDSYVIAVDIVCSKLIEAKNRVRSLNVDFICCDMSRLPLRSSSVYTAFSLFTLHEIDVRYIDSSLDEINRILVSNGLFLVVDKILDGVSSPSEELAILTEFAYHRARELVYGEKAFGVKNSREVIDKISKHRFNLLKSSIVSLGKWINGEEFLRNWGKETLRLLEIIRDKESRKELEEVIEKIRSIALVHGYGPIKSIIALFKKREVDLKIKS